jgi:polar amino acid transport system substrate-binding protein
VLIRRSLSWVATLAAAGSLALTGCAKNNEGSTAPTGSVSSVSAAQDLTALVPADIKSKGVITVGIDPTYAPNEYKNSSGKIVGFDVDLMDAIAQKLGLKTTYVESTFDNIIPGITAPTPKYDIGVSSFTDNKTREKTVDFVTYFNAGSQWASLTTKKVDPDNACGLKVAVQTGTIQDNDDVPARSKKCVAAGKPAIDKQRYSKQADATTAVILGKADAFVADSPVTAYGVKTSNGKLALAGDIYDAAPYGYPMKKGSPLVTPIQKALQALMDDGTYKQICAKWGNDAGEITQAKINDAKS